MGLWETLIQWGAPLLSSICLPSVKQDIQNCQILAGFTVLWLLGSMAFFFSQEVLKNNFLFVFLSTKKKPRKS